MNGMYIAVLKTIFTYTAHTTGLAVAATENLGASRPSGRVSEELRAMGIQSKDLSEDNYVEI